MTVVALPNSAPNTLWTLVLMVTRSWLGRSGTWTGVTVVAGPAPVVEPSA